MGGSSAFVGAFLGPGIRTENEMFSAVGERVVFRTPSVGCKVRGATRAFRDSVASVALPPSAQRAYSLMGAVPGSGSADEVAGALAKGAAPGSPLARKARSLADAVSGLMRDRGGCSDIPESYEEAPQWKQAIEAFQDYIRSAPDEAFAPPSPELLAIHAALQSVVAAALHR